MIVILDYGMGNLRSVQKALEKVGAEAVITDKPGPIVDARKLILPGVGAFGDAMTHLAERGMVGPILKYAESGRPLLGVCLGLQLLFERSEEDPGLAGLGILKGSVDRFRPGDPALKVPHMGWNGIDFDGGGESGDPMLAGVDPGAHVYFVHSYFANPADPAVVAATTDYGGPFCSAVRRGNIFATQFHPEKSQRVGLQILRNFAEL
jgi:glutamine amidotransferase